MITLITVAAEKQRIKSILKDEVKIAKEIETDALVSLYMGIEVPFELTEEEELKHVARILCKSGWYKEAPLTSKEKICVIGNFLEAGQAVYLAKKN